MPNPRNLKVGDLVQFVAIPTQWQQPGYAVHRDSAQFLRTLIGRKRPCRIAKLDEFGYPWIQARIRVRNKVVHHSWMITETDGWRRVLPRKASHE